MWSQNSETKKIQKKKNFRKSVIHLQIFLLIQISILFVYFQTILFNSFLLLVLYDGPWYRTSFQMQLTINHLQSINRSRLTIIQVSLGSLDYRQIDWWSLI